MKKNPKNVARCPYCGTPVKYTIEGSFKVYDEVCNWCKPNAEEIDMILIGGYNEFRSCYE